MRGEDRGYHSHQDWSYGQVNTENHNWVEQRLMSRNHHRNQHLGRKTWTVMDSCWRLIVDNSQLKSSGDPIIGEPQNIVRFASKNSNKFSQWISDRNPLMFPLGGREREPFKNMPKHFILLDKVHLQEKLVNQSLTCKGVPNSSQF